MKYQRAWIIYFWIDVFMLVFDTVQKIRGLSSLTPGPYYIIGLRVISFITLFGFAYQRKIGLRIIWQTFFIAHSYFMYRLLFGLVNVVRLAGTESDWDWYLGLPVFVLLVFTYFPVYYANFRYGFAKSKVWRNP
jgi:hypothetical protein